MTNKIVKFKVTTAATLCALGFCINSAHAWQSDNGNGTFTNPPLYADYPDPDIIRVGTDFYFATTTFVNSPGLTILHSQDLVNWEIVSHVISRLDGNPQYDMTNGTAYRSGVFAPSLWYYSGTFYVVVTPVGQNTRVYYSQDVRGPWQYHVLNTGAFDPGLYIETNGTGYIATSGGWDGHVTLLTLNANFSQVAASTGIFYYPGIEGSKVVKRGNWYYVFNARPANLSLMCSRATNIFGPYETIQSLNDQTGGHQGAIVDLPDGSDYGFVMKDSGAVGRMTYISPIIWSNNWPVWGTLSQPGRVPAVADVPIQGKPAYRIATSDDFSSPALGLQWQWNHNPDTNRWSLTARPGFLRLKPPQATNFWNARNTLTQKGQGLWSGGEVKLDLSNLKSGDICGFGMLGKNNGQIAVNCDGSGNKFLSMKVIVNNGATETVDTRVASLTITGTNLFLRTALDFVRNKGLCSYSFDDKNWTALGGEFNLAFDWATGTFQGEQFAIFCFNPQPVDGFVDVDWFRLVPPAGITDIVPDTNSSVKLYFANSPNSTNIIQATTNLTSAWQNISTNVADGTGLWQFTDTNTSPSPARFYRSYSR
jgi:beta-xylosidase